MNEKIMTYHFTAEQMSQVEVDKKSPHFRGPVRELNQEDPDPLIGYDLYVRGKKTKVVVIGYSKSESRDTSNGRELDYTEIDQELFLKFQHLWPNFTHIQLHVPDRSA